MSRLFLFFRRSENRRVTLNHSNERAGQRRGSDRRTTDRRIEPRFSVGPPVRDRRQTERRAQ
jgi:hypothetical protein